MIKLILIDDEDHCLDVLEKLITNYMDDVELIGRYSEPQEAINAILFYKPDLILLDIEMPLMSGFDLIDKLKPFEFNVIFTTAHNDMALRAYQYNVKNYLLKPISLSALKKSIEAIFPNASSKNLTLTHNKRTFSTQEGVHFISIDDILYCEAENSYCTIHFLDKKIVLSKTLKEVVDILDSDLFLRIHNSYIVNANHIAKYSKSEGGFVLLSNGSEVPISRTKREDFQKWIEKFGK